MEMKMIRILLAAAVVIGAAAFDLRKVQAHEAPWCAVVNLGNGNVHWFCQYATIESCVPNVLAGNRGFCNQNPAYNGPIETPHKHAARRRHRVY
jgi:Protein of unknown function (DUF3551)